MEKHIVTGIYNKEIFIANVEGGKIRSWDVIRPVSTDDLESMREPDEIKEHCRDLWKEAVRAGVTEQSLDDYVDDIIAECEMYENEEMYPCKDESFCEYLTPELREEADTYMLDVEGVEIGTWEASGCYAPKNSWCENFKKFDYVFNNEQARNVAEDYYKKIWLENELYEYL